MPVDTFALRIELETDPKGLGYASPLGIGDHAACAALLNTVRAGADYQIEVAFVSWVYAQAAVDATEYNALTQARRDAWGVILAHDEIPVKENGIRNQIQLIWSGSPITRSALVALQWRQGSRAEVLFGEGTIIGHDDIAEALST